MEAARNGAAAAANNGRREETRCYRLFCHYPGPMVARYLYAGIFLLANFFAWTLRESHVTFVVGQRLIGCGGDRDCLEAEGVLLISLTCFLFFTVMMISTMFTRKVQDRRNLWHSGWWMVKCILICVGALMISTLAPTSWITLYGKLAPFGAGLFIFIQLISVIRYITRLNYKWCLTNYEERCLKVILVSILAYSGSIVAGILMSIFYTGCLFNIMLIVITLLLVCLMFLISLKSKAKGKYMEPGLIGVYIVFLCWSAIKSEPETSCYKKEKGSSGENWKIIISFAVELVSVAVAAFSTGNDYKCIQFRNIVESEHDVPYGYGFFHFVFAMGSMYFGMLFVGWNTHRTMEKWNMDVGGMCTWVHIVNEGLAVICFVAILLARIYGIGWLRWLLAHIFGIGGQQQSGESQTIQLQMDTGGPPPSPLSQIPELQMSELHVHIGIETSTSISEEGMTPL